MKTLQHDWLCSNSVAIDKILHPMSLFLQQGHWIMDVVNDNILGHNAEQPFLTEKTKEFIEFCQSISNNCLKIGEQEGMSDLEIDDWILEDLDLRCRAKGYTGFFVVATRAKHEPMLDDKGEYDGCAAVHEGWRVIYPLYLEDMNDLPHELVLWNDKMKEKEINKAKQDWEKKNA